MKQQKEKHSNLSMNEAADLFHVSSSTIHNWVKERLLLLDEEHCITLESIRRFQSQHAGKHKLQARANKLLKDEHDAAEVGNAIQIELSADAFDDAIGNRYEAMLSESYKNKEGITYTPNSMALTMKLPLPQHGSRNKVCSSTGMSRIISSTMALGV